MHQSRPLQFCDRQEPWLTNAKLYAVYTIPTIDVQVAGTFRSVPGGDYDADFDASNEYLAANSTLGRPLAGGARNLRVDLIAPDSQHQDRRNELDLRIGYVLQAAGDPIGPQRRHLQRDQLQRGAEHQRQLLAVAGADVDSQRTGRQVQRPVRLLGRRT